MSRGLTRCGLSVEDLCEGQASVIDEGDIVVVDFSLCLSCLLFNASQPKNLSSVLHRIIYKISSFLINSPKAGALESVVLVKELRMSTSKIQDSLATV